MNPRELKKKLVKDYIQEKSKNCIKCLGVGYKIVPGIYCRGPCCCTGACKDKAQPCECLNFNELPDEEIKE